MYVVKIWHEALNVHVNGCINLLNDVIEKPISNIIKRHKNIKICFSCITQPNQQVIIPS